MKTVIDSNKIKLSFSDVTEETVENAETVETTIGGLLEGGTPINDNGDDMHFVAATLECDGFYCWRKKLGPRNYVIPDEDEDRDLHALCRLQFDSVDEAMHEVQVLSEAGLTVEEFRDYSLVRYIETDYGNPFC